MPFRFALVLVLIAAGLLPLAGWHLVKQTEALLREGQMHAQMTSAYALTRALAHMAPGLPAAGTALFVHEFKRHPLLDGYADDWQALEGIRSSDGALRVKAARRQNALWVLIEAKDTTRARVDAGNAPGPAGDRVELIVAHGNSVDRFLLGNAAPGPLQVWNAAGKHAVVYGQWQETSDGYAVELQYRGEMPERLGIAMIDESGNRPPLVRNLTESRGDLAPLVGRDENLSRILNSLISENQRARYVSGEGWVLATADRFAPRVQEKISRWQSWLYRFLLPDGPEKEGDFAIGHARLRAPLVWQALSGVPGASVSIGASGRTAVVAAAMPIAYRGEIHGTLLLEQQSDALLILTNKAVFGLMTATLLTALFASMGLFVYAGILSLRIRRLRNAAERSLQTDGRVSADFPYLDGRGDIGDLSRSFARLLTEVGSYTEYLKTLASKLSHELSTPLAIVRSSLDNLELEPLPVAANVFAQRAREGTERLTGILRSMSEANRLEQAIQQTESENFDLAALLRSCAESYRDLLAPRRLYCDFGQEPLHFLGSPELIAQALDKLVANAKSFAPQDGWVRIVAKASGHGQIAISVSNQGPLLPEGMQEHVFDSLVSIRGAEGEAPGLPHLGLGLFIVRLIAELHRGKCHAENLPDRSGVVFRVLLEGMPAASKTDA